MKSQLRFAASIAKNKSKRNSRVVKETTPATDDLVIPEEMSSWLSNSLSETDEKGYLPEAVGSALTQPLDSFAAFCPTGNLLTSKFSALRIPDKTPYVPSFSKTEPSMQSHMSYSSSRELERSAEPKKLDFDATVNRLNVMWLQRKAKLEKEDGNLDESFKTMQDAIDLHFNNESDYSKARPSDQVDIANPNELMLELDQSYFPYDSTAHNRADRIQRWYHKRFMKKFNAASLLRRVFRGFQVRKDLWYERCKQNQCARLIQRRFRIHFTRVCDEATRIKYWYRLQVSMRDYRERIFVYRQARRIQRLFRGNQGRKIGNYRRLRRNSAMAIQRNFHGYVVRRRRALGVSMFHKLFFNAAVKIQCLCRGYIAVCRAKARILEELMREERRMERENSVVQETIANEIARTKLYLKTAAGKLHYEACKRKIIAMDKEFERLRPTLTQQEILTHEAEVIFEVYDSDGSGTIDLEELRLMLVDLCVPVTRKELEDLALQLDADGSGDIDFAEFSEWFSEGGSNSSSGVRAAMFRQVLKARRLVLELSGQLLARRSERAVLRQCCSWLTNETKALFRLTDAPKFNCCKCLQTFVLFQDYIKHFTPSERLCVNTVERGMFHPKWWIHSEWVKQRECELETLRVTFEYPTLSYKAMLANYAELALQNDSGVSLMLQGQIDAACTTYVTLLEEAHAAATEVEFYGKPLSEFVYDIADICQDGFLSPNIAKQIANLLQAELPAEWILKSVWSFSAFRDWLETLPMLKRTARQSKSEEKVILQDSKLLASIYIKCLRLIRVGAETSIVALAEYRIKRPRGISISDSDLKRNKLHLLTFEFYNEVRQKLIKRLRIIRNAMRRMQLLAINMAKAKAKLTKFEKLKISTKNAFGMSYKPVISDEDPSEEEIELFEYKDTHVRANAYFKNRLQQRVGKTHVERLSKELWAHHKHIVDRYTSQNSDRKLNESTRRQMIQLDYYFSLFSSDKYKKGVNIRDLDLLLPHCLNLSYSNDEFSRILRELDPLESGMIQFEQFCVWVLSNKHKPYVSKKKALANWLQMRSTKRHARLQILTDIRRITRLELETQKLEIRAIESILSTYDSTQNDADADKNAAAKKKKADKKLKKRQLREAKKAQRVREEEAERIADLSAVLKALRDDFDTQEQRVLTRMAEDDAEGRAKRQILFSRRGRYFLSMEKHLLSIADEVIGVFGESIAKNAPLPAAHSQDLPSVGLGWELALKVLMHCFDTDCSGTFDEGEITLLLKCVKKSIPEKWILYYFPDVIVDSSTLKQVTSYLLPRVRWRKVPPAGSWQGKWDISIGKRSFRYASKLLLISLSRQSARDKSLQAAKLAKTGVLEDLSAAKYERDVSQGLIMRCQLLAMRQVHQFVKTEYGKIRLTAAKKRLEGHWSEVRQSQHSGCSIMEYAFKLHAVSDADPSVLPPRLLSSEFPHLIRYLVTEWKWLVREDHRDKIAEASKCFSDSDVRWIDMEEARDFLQAAFVVNKRKFFKSSMRKADPLVRMLSIARQQALLIAIDYPDKKVHETNFRCFILGLDMFMRLNKYEGTKLSEVEVNWTKVPNDAMLIYLLSQGFTYDDLLDSCDSVYDLKCDFYNASDVIREDDFVDPNEKLSIAMKEVFSRLSVSSSIHRMLRFLGGGFQFLFYKKVVRILTHHRDEVNYLGRLFLDEIIIGVSHCSLE